MVIVCLYPHSPFDTDIDERLFEKQDWTDYVYGECHGNFSSNAPEFIVFGFNMRAFVDPDHVRDSTTRCYRSGLMVHLYTAPIYWKSNKQTSIETSSFGYELIAMDQFCECICVLCYKLQMMGITCNFPSYSYSDY